jgi:MFS family permease
MNLLGDMRGRAAWVVFGAMVCQLGLAYGFVLSPLAGGMIDEFGWTAAEYGAARSFQLPGMALATPVAGYLVLRLGARSIVLVSAAIMALAVFGMSRIDSLWQFMALAALMGVGMAGIGDITMGALVVRWVERGRGKALGLVYAGSNLGGALFAPVAAWLAATTDWRSALVWLAIGGGLVLVPLGASLLREPETREPPLVPDAGGPTVDVLAENLDLRRAIRTRSFWILAFTLLSMFFFYLSMNTHLVLFLENVGLDNQTATGWYALAIAMGLAVKLASGFIADLMQPKHVLVLDQALFTAASAIALLVPGTGSIELFVITYGICTAGRDVAYPLAVVDCFGARYLGEIYGVLNLALLPGGFIGPIFAGWVVDRFGSYDIAFVCFSLLNLTALALLFTLRRERRLA